MAVDYLTGFEFGVVSTGGAGLFNTATAGSVVSTDPRTGVYHGEIVGTGGVYFIRKNHTARQTLVVRAYIKIVSLPASGTRGQIHSTLLAGVAIGNIEIDSAGAMQAAFRDPTNLQGSAGTGPTVSADGQYHLLEIHYSMTGSPNTISWRWDGVAQNAASFTNAARTSTNSNWGQVDTTATYRFRVDDWIQGDNASDYPFGPGYITWLLPGSDGTHSFTNNDFSTGDAGTLRANTYTDFWLMVDEAAPWTATRSTTDNIAQRVIRTTGYVEIRTGTTPETGNATAVRALIGYSASTTGADTAGCIIRNSAGTATVIWGDLPVAQGGNGGALTDWSESTNFFKGAIVTSPGTWTPTEVNALRWRFGGADDVIGIPTLQMVALEIDYPEVAASAIDDKLDVYYRNAVGRASVW